MVEKLFVFILLAVALNIPFGSYRLLTRKFSLAWWLAIHLPIPIIILLRKVAFNLPLWVIPISIASAFVGQIYGGKLALFGQPEINQNTKDTALAP